jgi:hypothetical protein
MTGEFASLTDEAKAFVVDEEYLRTARTVRAPEKK